MGLPVAPAQGLGHVVVAHVVLEGRPCVDRPSGYAAFEERYYKTTHDERWWNLLAEIDAWPGEPATYDLGSPASP